MVSRKSFQLAILNISKFGDTDVFPLPLENHWFHDEPDRVIRLLKALNDEFSKRIEGDIPYDRSLSPVGYLGFRSAVQIDPLWNAYLLALVIEIAPDIERVRLQTAENRVFAYRFRPDHDAGMLFDADLGWGAYQERALALSKDWEYVVSTDISDFYSRVYHHRLENALIDATTRRGVVARIMNILNNLVPGNVSFGLPVGGNAARILAELLLNRTDRRLNASGLEWCRFVDDYYLFANTRDEAQKALAILSDVLHHDEGLTLSRTKTRVMSRSEFSRLSPVVGPDVGESAVEQEARAFLKIRLRYDPYSASADDDYEALVGELNRFDIVGMLARELRKTRIDERLTKQLVRSLRYLSGPARADAVSMLTQNIGVLYPLFPLVARVLRGLIDDLDEGLRTVVFDTLRNEVDRGSHVACVATNLGYIIRLLALDLSESSTRTLNHVYGASSGKNAIRRDVILAMARKGVVWWLSERLRDYRNMSAWERRAMVVATYALHDEGRHWRKNHSRRLDSMDSAYLEWLGAKNNGQPWTIPL